MTKSSSMIEEKITKNNRTTSLGICLGASTIKAVIIEKNGDDYSVLNSLAVSHGSDPRQALCEMLGKLDLKDIDYCAFTGRKFKEIVKAASLTEAEAVEYALSFERKRTKHIHDFNVLVSLGAESFIAYLLDTDGALQSIETGNKCASGTGEFFLQQIKRMNVSPGEAILAASTADRYPVSGRCSVFCKSDCTHALNKGIPVGRVAAGLCRMMAEKIVELIEKLDHKRVIAVGGVTQNKVVINDLKNKVDALYVPEHAAGFEALGAALYALDKQSSFSFDLSHLFYEGRSSFSFLPPIAKAKKLVSFKEGHPGKAQKGDLCIVGLDVGSTTTKGVVLRVSDNAVLASEYLRTNGDPVTASRNVYAALDSKLGVPVNISAIGTTGSGRHIAGLHASATCVINEIIAHATGAAFYDSEVDTIFEIGGQDAKYTHLTNGVPSDYAMNEACSAGTGSFLEESAFESMGLSHTQIEGVALTAKKPPNFNDQCAAFISSDIKTATQEGVAVEDITAGLVYSVCMNYVNRVKGQRPSGNKIFMQGGVCYNKAVPLAMASLIEREIVVPPDPGLIGAFGVALETKNRIETGLADKGTFSLKELAAREIEYGKPFICGGGKEKCDRGCEIAVPIIDGKKIPFGGACDRFYNKHHQITCDVGALDLVRARQNAVYGSYVTPSTNGGKKRVGLSRSYLMNTFFPLFNTFFTEIGCTVVLSEKADPEGLKRRRSSFCYPGELAHGFFGDLLERKVDYIFLPKIMSLKVDNSVNTEREHQSTCVLLQSEAYYIKSAFKDKLGSTKLMTPVLDFWKGFLHAEPAFIKIAQELGVDKKTAIIALKKAAEVQTNLKNYLKEMGREVLEQLEDNPEQTAVVLFGRSYNAFAKEGNLGIPTKFASRGTLIVPWDALPFEDEPCDKDMCWASGQDILRAASFVKKHPRLFGAFVTNFSCGPDSFLLTTFRDIMQAKPSLTLELDSHTADAGVNTRIEAFLDIVKRYLEIKKQDAPKKDFTPARAYFKGSVPQFVTSEGEEVTFYDKRVKVLIPSMGRLSTEILTAAFQGIGVRAESVPVYDHDDLKLGRKHTSCKECLPLLLTVGGLLKYLERRTDENELLAYFMPFTPGNCRFPQYRVFFRNLIQKQHLKNVTLFSLNAEKGYSYKAFSGVDRLNVLKGFVVADVMEDIYNTLTVIAADKTEALRVFEEEWQRIIETMSSGNGKNIYKTLEIVSRNLAAIPLSKRFEDVPKVGLMGEIFVRKDYFSCQDLVERLAARGIIVKRAHFFEWLKYVDNIIKRGIYEPHFSLKDRLQFGIKLFLQSKLEKRIKGILSKSNLYEYEFADIDEIIEFGENFFDARFRGESILVVGNFFKDMLHSLDGVISIGPFACMPTRVIEAVLSAESTMQTKLDIDPSIAKRMSANGSISRLPFLSVETDGNPFPQILEARIESFALQVCRLKEKTNSNSSLESAVTAE